jgi:putative spermidine/putrescine transport system permease protein
MTSGSEPTPVAMRATPGRGLSVGAMLAFGLCIVTLLLPLLAVVVTSFGLRWFGSRWLPEAWTLRWYRVAAEASNLPDLLANSLLIAALCVVISISIGTPAAWALARRRIRARRFLILLLLLPRTIPPIAVGLGFSQEFYVLGLVDTHIGIALAHSILVVPLVILVMTSAFEGLDERLLEAARVCGASTIQTLWHVIRPLATPGLLVAVLFAFVTSLNEFTLTLLTYGPRTVTLTVQTYLEIDKGFKEIASAVAVFVLVPSLVFLALVQRYIRPESIIGGVKGL